MRYLLGVVALLLVAGCGTDASTGDKGYVSGEGTVSTYKAAERKKAPAISGTTLQGKKVSVDTLAAGRPTVVNIWASWCGPCRQEASTLIKASQKLGSTASFVGINVRNPEGRASGLAYERRFDVTYPSIYDPEGRTLLGMPKGITVYAIPSTIVLDGQGRIAATIVGAVPSALTVEELVKSAA
ncbi:TlpA family protein disulfide reductase [Nocardioides mangrovicus]|uniref:TlpA family protein disulfide reductase n=1 Tax=Nocardioides mangrovicus TaxID=2478913 RepID=A0A3L8P6C9_9ACTN|nr:TlpA disulfide reductase family protein [Nocardioides mangrovicus]RLV50497.1 TlpA family protein disulfide reductase [Nocardioides mangrovicus]